MNKVWNDEVMVNDMLAAEGNLSIKYCAAISRSGTMNLRNKLIYAHTEVQQVASALLDEAVSRGWAISAKADKQLIENVKSQLESKKKAEN